MSELESVGVSATIIVISRDFKALILQRPPNKAFANLWTVAGGKLRSDDGIAVSEGMLYDSVEKCAKRELLEETGIHLFNTPIHYLCSITASHGDFKRVILSYYVFLSKDAKDIKLTLAECQAAHWITEAEIPEYGFIPDIGGEIKEVFKIRHAEIERIIMGH